MDKKVAATTPAAGAPAGRPSAAVSRAEVVPLWEALLDEQADTEAAQDLFMDALLRDARADHARKEKLNKEQAEDSRFAHVFEPWQLPARGSVPMPPPPEQKPMQEQPVVVAARPPVQVARTLVLGLRAPTHLARNRKQKHDRAPPGPAAPAGERHPPEGSKKRRVL